MAGRSWVGRPGWCGQEGFSPTTRPGWTTTRAPRGAGPLIRPDSGCEADHQDQKSRRRRGEPGQARSIPGDGISPSRSAPARISELSWQGIGLARHQLRPAFCKRPMPGPGRIAHSPSRPCAPGRRVPFGAARPGHWPGWTIRLQRQRQRPDTEKAHNPARARDRHPSGPRRVARNKPVRRNRQRPCCGASNGRSCRRRARMPAWQDGPWFLPSDAGKGRATISGPVLVHQLLRFLPKPAHRRIAQGS